MPRRTDAPGDLLFGLLALQTGLITQTALIAAFHAWSQSRDRPMGEILVEQKALDASHKALVEGLVGAHLKMHGGDPEKSLAALGAGPSTLECLATIGDPDLDAGLTIVGSTQGDDGGIERTLIPPPGDATSAGRRFKFLRFHDSGALGEVFVALDTEFNREVALKEIKLTYAHDPVCRDRFLREAEITGNLEHPGIVPVYGLGTYADGRPFYAMQFIKGGSLKEAIAAFHGMRGSEERSRELRNLLGRFIGVCDAIAYAHSRGVLHLDLKPSNIMVGPYGETLVVDWGLARVQRMAGPGTPSSERPIVLQSAGGSAETVRGLAQGTPAYMSPEQAAGDRDRIDPRSDVYSLGATLYSLLTGKPPFEGDASAALRAVQKGEFGRPSEVDPAIDKALDAVCLKAMCLKPEDRYASPLLLADDVKRWLADEPVAAHPEGPRARLGRWARHHRDWVQAGAVLLAFLVVGVVGVAIQQGFSANRLRGEQEKTKRALAAETEQRKTAQAQTELANRRLYLVDMNSVQRFWEDNNPALFRQLLDEQLPANQVGDVDRRGFEWYYWERKSASGHRTFKGHTSVVEGVAFSPDGTSIASASYDQTVRVWDAATGHEALTLKGHTSGVEGVAFSPDGNRIASASVDKTVRVWDAATGHEALTLKGHTDGVEGVAFSPDGNRIASASWDRTVRVWDAATGQEALTLKGHTDGVHGVAFSPDGNRIASAGADKTVRVWDAATGHEALALKGHTDKVFGVAFSPDGTRIAAAGADMTVRVWDAATGHEALVLWGHTAGAHGVAFSPDGNRIASASHDGTVRVWDAATGREALALKGHTDGVVRVAFSPDGLHIASASWDKTVRVWDAAAGKEALELNGHTAEVRGVAFSPDGNRIASASDDHTVRVWDAAIGHEALTLKGHTDKVHGVAFSPDGNRVTSASYDETVRVWDAATGHEALTLKGHADKVFGVAFSPDGNRIASAGADKTVRVWDAVAGREALELNGHTAEVRGVAFSPDGNRIASASVDKTVRVWDAATGHEALTLKGHTDGVEGVAFSPDGNRIASASWDRTVRVWDAATGKEALAMKGHTSAVEGVAFSPDGNRIASASWDKTVRVWDAATGQEALALKGHTSGVEGVAFSPDGTRIAAASADHTVRVWDARPVGSAERQATRP